MASQPVESNADDPPATTGTLTTTSTGETTCGDGLIDGIEEFYDDSDKSDDPAMVAPVSPTNQEKFDPRTGLWLAERLGQGAFAVVYLARRQPGETPNLVVRSFTGQSEAPPEYQSRMRRRFWSGLRHHSMVSELAGVVTLHEAIDDPEHPCAVLEYVDGVTFSDMGGSLADKVRVLQKLARTVQMIHGVGVVHRDIKPDNVLVRTDSVPVVVDFDLAAKCQGLSPTTWDPTETPILPGSNYHHPEFREAFDRSQADARYNGHNIRQPAVDVFGIGGLLLLALTGEDPQAEFATTEREVMHSTHTKLVEELGVSSANLLLDLSLQCLTPRLRDVPALNDVIRTIDEGLAPKARSTHKTVREFVFGVSLRTITDLRRSYSPPVLRTMRLRRNMKMVVIAIAFLYPLLLWKIAGTPPAIHLTWPLGFNATYIITGGKLKAIVGAAAPKRGRQDAEPRDAQRVVSTSIRLVHHAHHVSWMISLIMLIVNVFAVPWVIDGPGANEHPVLIAGDDMEHHSGLDVALREPPVPRVDLPSHLTEELTVTREFPDGMMLAIWSSNDDGAFVTTFIDSEGRSIKTCDSLIVGTPINTWEVVPQKKSLVVPSPINPTDEVPIPGRDSHPTRKDDAESTAFYVRGLDNPGSTKVIIPSPPASEDGLVAISHEYKILGGYGSLLFIRESRYEYGGGISGFDTHSFHVVDLSMPEPSLTLYTGNALGGTLEWREGFLTSGEYSELRSLGEQLKHPQNEFSRSALGSREKGTLVGYFPTYPGGRLSWVAQFVWDASRGDSDGYWDTYTESRFVPVPNFAPSGLIAVGRPKVTTTSELDLEFRGWSWVRTGDLTSIERRPDCQEGQGSSV